MDLQTVFNDITQTEEKLIPILVTNPANQAIAGLAFLGEQALFNLILNLHSQKSAAPVAAVPAPAPVVAAPVQTPSAFIPVPGPNSLPASSINLGIASGLQVAG
jgi:hypothetical protein